MTVVSALSEVAFTFAKYEPQLADNNKQGTTREKYKKYKWGVGSNWSFRKRSWRQEIVDVGSGSACGEYSPCWSCSSFSFTFETWHKQLHTNEFLSGFLAD